MTITSNYIGETIFVSAGNPTANTAAAFALLTWTKANGIQQLPELGTTNANIDVEDLESGFTTGVKGAAAGNDSSMAFRSLSASDTGQEIIRTAANGQQGLLSIRIVDGSGVANAPVAGDPLIYAQGYAHSFVENQGNSGAFKGFTASFKQNALSIVATVPV